MRDAGHPGIKGFVRRWGWRAIGLAITGVGLYVVAPSVIALLDQWPQLQAVRPAWFVVLVILEAGSVFAFCVLVRMTLPTVTWFNNISSELAGNAAAKIVPGGNATGTVVEASMLVKAGQQPAAVAAALGSIGLLTTGTLLALPILTIPAVIIQPPPARQLQLGLIVSLVVALVLMLLGLAVLKWNGFLVWIARIVGKAVHLVRRRVSVDSIVEKVIAQRDAVAAAFVDRWWLALGAAAANRMLDYAALVAALYAVGGKARPSMVLLAYVVSLALAMVPITPGGLGFVEAGLTSVLVLAGVEANAAVVATLLYRLVSYWLPIPVGALAWAGWRLKKPGVAGPPDQFGAPRKARR
jgi:uncharacterized protein (TIRG00374 family)